MLGNTKETRFERNQELVKNRRELLREEYLTLRSEIQESIRHQHQILLSGYGAALATFAAKTSFGSRVDAFVVAPFILFVMAALWSAECNRMVRAGYYIAFYLWPDLFYGPYRGKANWEMWVRCEEETKFGPDQDLFQSVVVFWGPFVATLATCGLIVWEVSPDWRTNIWLLGFPLTYLLLAAAWCWLWWQVKRVSNLRKDKPDDIEAVHYSDADCRAHYPKIIQQKAQPSVHAKSSP